MFFNVFSCFRNHAILAEVANHVTRFIALAKYNDPKKRKYLYAFNTVPMKYLSRAKLVEQPQDATEFPFRVVVQQIDAKLHQAEIAGNRSQRNQYFFDENQQADNSGENDRGGRKRGRHFGDGDSAAKRQPAAPCWFCLSSPEIEKHLIVDIGHHAYMALPKGGLVPDHLLILPVNHIQSMVAAPEDVRDEIEKYKKALIAMYAKQNKCVAMFERNFKTQHLQIL